MEALFSNSPMFMGVLTLVLISLIARFLSYNNFFLKSKKDAELSRDKSKDIRSIGLLALVIGALHQLIAWYNIIYEIEEAGDINAGIVMTALKNSMVPLIYGLSIFLLSIILGFISSFLLKEKK